MSQQVNDVEKHVAQEDAAIAIPDKEIVSINYIFLISFIFFTYFIFHFLENSPQFP